VWVVSGRKKAVFIGINYFGTQAELRGTALKSLFLFFESKSWTPTFLIYIY
jgi:hypothetical protein